MIGRKVAKAGEIRGTFFGWFLDLLEIDNPTDDFSTTVVSIFNTTSLFSTKRNRCGILFIYFKDDVLRINLFMRLALQSMVSDNYTLLLAASKI